MKTRVFIVFCGISLFASKIMAIDLLEVYKQAVISDPTFKAASAQWRAENELLAIKRAPLLPQLGAKADLLRDHNNLIGISGETGYRDNNTVNYQLALTQSIFDFGKWANVWQAQANVQKAGATYMAAVENLLWRTSVAYFDVLQAKDVLSYTRANRDALERLLTQTKHRYEVGLIAITDLENTRADYDQAIAKEIAAANDLSDKVEKLAEITGIRYLYLNPVKASFPLLSPQPSNIDKWVSTAEKQNFDLAAARYASAAARENIKIQNAGHLPTLDASGSVSNKYNSNPSGLGFLRNKGLSAGLTLNLPIFQGGQVTALAKQANYQYQKTVSDQETKHRSVVSQTRQNYLGVLASISEIKANRQSIKSAQSSLRANQAGYEVGTRTMVDVLQAQTKLYESQKNYTTSEYNYIKYLLSLKQNTGILDVNDLVQINFWLTKQNVDTSEDSTTKEDALRDTISEPTTSNINTEQKQPSANTTNTTSKQPQATSSTISNNKINPTPTIVPKTTVTATVKDTRVVPIVTTPVKPMPSSKETTPSSRPST